LPTADRHDAASGPAKGRTSRWPSLSLRATVLLAIAGAVLLPTAALWHLDQKLTRATHEPLIAQAHQSLLTITANALVEPIWTIDEALTRSTAERALTNPAVIGLRLIEKRPNTAPLVLKRAQQAGMAGQTLQMPITREGTTLGELELTFDPGEIDVVLADRRNAVLQLAVLQILVGLGLLVPVMTVRLLNPLRRLKQQASDIASRADVPPMAWSRRDELGQLGQHLNQVHAQIDDLFGQLEAKQVELKQIALHDALTGLPNRRLFAELTQAAVAVAQRDKSRLALLFVDIDRFKSINDSQGHAVGDQVLQTLAARMRASVRNADVVCRQSGDEFTVLMRNVADWEEVATLADRLLKETETPVPVGDREVAVSASIGIAVYPDDAHDPEELVRHADAAMYAAKNLGRARYSFYRAEFNTQLQASLEVEKALMQGLKNREFALHYQPLVRAFDGMLCGCEALLRWTHPTRGMVSPAEFIPAAEQCGLISELGAFAIRSACEQIAEWKAAGLVFGPVAVNVSALEFRHHRLVDTITTAMADYGVQAHELEIELTESVLMTDTDNTQRIVERLQGLGLRMAMDDFGTGYSSLAYLKRLRPSKIKIDRAFVRDLPGDVDDRVLVPAIVQLAKALGISVVAEGVETEAQRAFLDGCGCDVLQGYLISRPQPAKDFERFARAAIYQHAALA
jgi:diguanylate cyclase (GGDEF)-like protein